MLNLSLVRRLWKILSTTWLWKIFVWPHIWFKNSDLFVQGKICYIDWFKCAEFNGGVLLHLCNAGNTLFGQVCSKKWKLVHSLSQIWRTQWWCSLFLFLNDTPFYRKFISKNQNCLLKLKFETQTNLNMQNLMVMFFFLFQISF